MLSRYPMLNLLWAGMIIAGIFFAAFTGQIPEITKAALDSSKEAVTLCHHNFRELWLFGPE